LPQSIVRRTFAVLLALVAFWMVVRSAGRA
jgi:hypothetical protein